MLLVSALGAAQIPSATAQAGWIPDTPANWSTVSSRSVGAEQLVTAGVTTHSDVLNTVAGREPAQVVSIDPKNANVRLGVVNAGDTLINPKDEKITSMAARTGAVAGVNGGYFAINASGQATGGQIIDGEIWKSPEPGRNGMVGVKPDGSIVIGAQTFSGTIIDGAASHALSSLNWTDDATGTKITEITPRLGGPTDVAATKPTLVLGTSTDGGKSITVTSINAITTLPALAAGTAGLLASGAGATWLTNSISVGDTVTVSTQIAPDNDLQQLVQGPGQLLKDGAIFTDPTNQNPPATQLNPESAIGTTVDGKLVMVALDGHGTTSTAIGVTSSQVAGYLLNLGVRDAVLLDGGGSTGLVTRAPGDTVATLRNTPSDNTGERPVGNGIFVYSTAPAGAAPTSASVAGGNPVTAVTGLAQPIKAFASDNRGNPVDDGKLTVTANPTSLGTWANGVFSPGAAGTGTLTVTDGAATAFVPLTVADSLATLRATPAAPDLDNGATTTETLVGSTAEGQSLPVTPQSAHWTLSDPKLGSIDPATGVFTAAADGSGLETVTVTAGGSSTEVSIAVGSTSVELDPLSDSTAWTYSIKNGATATVTTDPQVPAGSAAASSIRLDYTMPGTSGVHQMVISPKKAITISANAAGQDPTALGVWLRVDDQVHDAFEFATSWKQSNGQSTTVYDTAIVYNGWALLKTPIPAGTAFPLSLNWIDMLSINPTKASTGTMRLSSLQALYSARTPAANDYTAIPQNPKWLSYVESPSEFTDGGHTFLMGDDAHMLANQPEGVSSHVMDTIAKRVGGTAFTSSGNQEIAPLPAVAVPDTVQMLGDMSDDGKQPDLDFAKGKIAALGKPFHDLVGNHEITQGADAETGGFSNTFGDTHYSYTAGPSTVIALDNAHGGITLSDPFQAPAAKQYQWLQQQLDAVTTPVAIVSVHMPAYDPFPAKNSQFNDRWEAQQYLKIVQSYQDTHPQTHVIMTYGHARGFSEQILDPQGNQVSGSAGIPQFVFADLGMPAYGAIDRGGFYNFGLVNVTADGRVQVDVEPVIESLSISAAAGVTKGVPLPVGSGVVLAASGVEQTGTNVADPITLPIADPVSHRWTSSDPKVASVDPITGAVTAVAPGTASISITAGGLTDTAVVTVVAAAAPGDPGVPSGPGVPGAGGGGGGVTTPVSTSGPLAFTGVNAFAGLLGGALLIAIGVVVTILRRRARTDALPRA
ncbi:phosphodiester glycosidase family protein [Lacisediminihabitans changchengi]|uniref:Phosphodiester glycosidase family protein n=1 Tax=Lacisediminihabitans changchengi TaxID=2787634 RepID=A0A934STF0_9MICO|nr:phosphodiester glycosidase family protein [Lacisediminihabitans changchengi]MBK4348620.1 phosphodiester glycosidase family protein [Lacisediminihabitans changchengi]